MIIDRFLAEQSRRRNVPRIFSPIDHVPAHIAWIDALCVQRRRLLSVICIKIMSQSCLRSLFREHPTYDLSTLFPVLSQEGLGRAACS